METKTVKISSSNYRMLCEFAGGFQKQLGAPVSIDKTLSLLLSRSKLSDLAGSWKMSDSEEAEMMKNLRKGKVSV